MDIHVCRNGTSTLPFMRLLMADGAIGVLAAYPVAEVLRPVLAQILLPPTGELIVPVLLPNPVILNHVVSRVMVIPVLHLPIPAAIPTPVQFYVMVFVQFQDRQNGPDTAMLA